MLEPKLTLSFMEMCYQSCCFGYLEPTHVIMSVDRREELRRLILSSFKQVPEVWKEANGQLGFNGAVVIGLPNFTDTYIWMANVHRPENPGLTHRFTITEGWKGPDDTQTSLC